MLIWLWKQTKVTSVEQKPDAALTFKSDKTNTEVTFMPEG